MTSPGVWRNIPLLQLERRCDDHRIVYAKLMIGVVKAIEVYERLVRENEEDGPDLVITGMLLL